MRNQDNRFHPWPGPAFRGAVRLPLLLWRGLRWKAYRGNWLPGHLLRHRPFDRFNLPGNTPIDVMVVIVDHFEPTRRFGHQAAVQSVASWCEGYQAIADRHRDADGRRPQHTWFYRYDYPNPGCLRVLSDYTYQGLGEVEFHLHHGHDTHETFAAKLASGLDWFSQAGAMLTAEARPQQRFGYIAGNWALDNGVGEDHLSGCNTELLALRNAGCYADFTFPALGSRSQPQKTNSIYYAVDDPQPKSYDWGSDARVGEAARGDLMIFEGPLVLDWDRGTIEASALETFAPPASSRLHSWLNAHVHVKGRPEWVFVKLHTHGMQSRETFLSPELDSLFEAMAKSWNRPPFRLHFVTAREAYNIAKAAEAGLQGNPDEYRDFVIAPPANRRIRCNVAWRLLTFGPRTVSLQIVEEGPCKVEFAEGPLHSLQGSIRRVNVVYQKDKVARLWVDGDGDFEVRASPHAGIPTGKHLSARALHNVSV